jgi:hypothetical protein
MRPSPPTRGRAGGGDLFESPIDPAPGGNGRSNTIILF